MVPPTAGSTWTAYVDCQAGDKVMGGGFHGRTDRGLIVVQLAFENGASVDNRWFAQINNPTSESLPITMEAMCADLTP